METSIPCGISQRTQWMQKYAAYQQNFIAARDAFNAANTMLHSPALDGMPHGTGKSDPVANQVERYNKSYRKYIYARDAMDVAKNKRLRAMQPLNSDQQVVLKALYFDHLSRRALAKELSKSDFWVRAQERTGLFLLELPSGWELDILP